jgi:tetratricopeptide (TPR) repeat protein/peptidoglycan/xylan/chitin deacetylase (PgdA/CDA1 family)
MKKILSLLIVGSLLTPAFSEGPSIAELQQQAIAQVKAGHYAEAAQLYQRVLESTPDDKDGLKDLMWAQWNAGAVVEAQKTAWHLIKLDGADKSIWSLLGRSYLALGRLDQAKTAYEKVLQISPDNAEALLSLSRITIDLEDLEGAEKILNRLQRAAPSEANNNSRLSGAWKSLALAYMNKNQTDKAIELYKKANELNPEDIKMNLTIARLYSDSRRYADAEALLQIAAGDPSLQQDVFPRLAKIQFQLGKYGDAAATWRKALALSPDNNTYKFQAARAFYFSGNQQEAVEMMQKLLNDDQQKRLALDFLVDDAVARANEEEAADLIETNLLDLKPEDLPRLQRLAGFYQDLKRFNDGLRTIERCRRLNPHNANNLILMADWYSHQGMYKQSIERYLEILRMNPVSVVAFAELATMYAAIGKPRPILKILEPFMKTDSKNPNLLIIKAQALYDAGHPVAAKRVLKKWLNDNTDPILTVLLYHGLTPFNRDPLLAHSVHMSTASFESQMKMLSQNGFTPVSAGEVDAWYKGKLELPRWPVLITFDDGRVDSFQYADPILEKYKLKATCFAIVHYVERNLPGYVNWDELRKYMSTGRWEVQAHGDMGHSSIPIDKEGNKGLFICNRMWLPAENRLESSQEWEERVRADYQRCKRKIFENLGTNPTVFAFPEGNFGQLEVPNFPDAAEQTLQLTKQEFSSCFVQDTYGLNTRTRDPFLLTRVEPSNQWTGDDLLRHISDNNAFSRMRQMLLHWALWENHPREAEFWLQELKKSRASPYTLLAEEADIRASEGKITESKELVKKARTYVHDPIFIEPLDKTADRLGAQYVAGVRGTNDSKRRSSWFVDQSFEFHPHGDLLAVARARHGQFKERDTHFQENGLGLDLGYPVTRYQNLLLQSYKHFYSDDITSRSTLRARVNSFWTTVFGTEAAVGKTPLDTAKAVAAGVYSEYGDLTLSLRPENGWRVKEQGTYSKYTDENKRFASTFELGRTVAPIWILYRLTNDNTRLVSPLYYSPQHLVEHQLGLEIPWRISSDTSLTLQYFPGYGKETGSSGSFVQNADIFFLSQWHGRNFIEVSFDWGETPTFRNESGHVAVGFRFK